MEIKAEEERFYRSLNYEKMEEESCGTMRVAFCAFVDFARRLAEDLSPFAFTGARVALQAADTMAGNILKSASEGAYGMMTDREVDACLKVSEVQEALLAYIAAFDNIGEDSVNDDEHIDGLTRIQEDLVRSTLLLRILALPLLAR